MPNPEHPPLYLFALGPAYALLPEPVRRMHLANPIVTARGTATVTHGESALARWLARRLGFPAAGSGRTVEVTFRRIAGGELLSRRYADATLTTLQTAEGPAGAGRIGERFGPVTLRLTLLASEEGLAFRLESARLGILPLPRLLLPRLTARESAAGAQYCFFVRIDLPLLGRLIQYEGRLMPPNGEECRPGGAPQ
jgi:hypothetical protein